MSRTAVAATLAALALLTAGCQSSNDPLAGSPDSVTNPVPTTPTVATTAPEVVVPTVTPTSAAPSPTASPTPAPATYDVKGVKTQLTALHYYAGTIDTDRTAALRSAVMAFQKVNGLHADGGVGKLTLAALKAPKAPTLRGTGGGRRVEVDLTKQVLYVVQDGKVVRILPVSSGSGKKYLTKSGGKATALSPVGYYKITRRIIGERVADLGTLYDPQYFYRGWAIHGSNSVPAYPASHGCIRVTRADAKYLLKAISVGTAVYVYGGSHVFTAGSSAPGTDDPGGDTPDTTPAPSATPTTTATPTPTATASPTPSTAPTIHVP